MMLQPSEKTRQSSDGLVDGGVQIPSIGRVGMNRPGKTSLELGEVGIEREDCGGWRVVGQRSRPADAIVPVPGLKGRASSGHDGLRQAGW
jgi:hypothetical protein